MANNKDITGKKVTDWLNSQGYPLEMIVASTFRKAGFTVSLSDWYEDFETKEHREIDVTALQWSDLRKSIALQICWQIECKIARDKPWVIFVSMAQPERFLPFNLIASDFYRSSVLDYLKQNEPREKLMRLPLFEPKYVGYGITQTFTTGLDVPYKAIMSSVKSSIDRVNKLAKINELELKTKRQYLCVAFPVIVIDGKLFECLLDLL
jgi:hypothetical protein